MGVEKLSSVEKKHIRWRFVLEQFSREVQIRAVELKTYQLGDISSEKQIKLEQNRTNRRFEQFRAKHFGEQDQLKQSDQNRKDQLRGYQIRANWIKSSTVEKCRTNQIGALQKVSLGYQLG
ncbi:hypothetical protein F511_41053 [Dorcoceras hygrometricum]|uniref:Uncharacterized protein n=1 Tax=Dorcoceras hygrometricum TaxID=472368 RepID=A0A2Z7C1Q3_9LAMI|nr:hypothetical protein F511_41053 [Dorcoceras hygrometricum]